MQSNKNQADNNKKKLDYKRMEGNHVKIVQTQNVKNDPLVNAIVNQPPSDTDPNGSYTGRPMNENETPTQDADDL